MSSLTHLPKEETETTVVPCAQAWSNEDLGRKSVNGSNSLRQWFWDRFWGLRSHGGGGGRSLKIECNLCRGKIRKSNNSPLSSSFSSFLVFEDFFSFFNIQFFYC